jgi:hypothetical protein
MAEPVALGIKPPTTMSLGDMVNIARGAQAYQQAEQVNPLLLQQAQQAARTGQIELSVKEQGDKERKDLQSFMSNPQNWQNETGDVDVNKINAEVTRIAPLTGREHIDKLTTLAKSQTEYTKSSQDLNQSERAIIGVPLAVLGRMNVKTKEPYIQELDNIKKFHPDNKRIQRQIEAQKVLINQMPEGSDFASAGIRASESLLTATEARSAFAPTSATTSAGQVVTTKPSIGGQNPEVAYSTPQGVTPMPNTVELNGIKYEVRPPTTAGGSPTLMPLGGGGQAPAPTAPRAQNAPSATTQPAPAPSPTSGLVPQDMPVPVGGIPQMNTQQAARYEEGNALKSKSTDLAKAASESKQTTRKIKENIASAAGSAPGQALRSAGKWLAGSEQLDELVKNLAQNQVDQAALMGNSAATDAARSVLGLANGSENITPQALAQIVQRADATSTGLEKFNLGLGNYYQKQGAYNGPIHARNFKDTWAKNYDPRIFMVQNVNSSNMSQAEKQLQLQAIMKGTSDEERKALAKKAEIIKRLEKGDF